MLDGVVVGSFHIWWVIQSQRRDRQDEKLHLRYHLVMQVSQVLLVKKSMYRLDRTTTTCKIFILITNESNQSPCHAVFNIVSNWYWLHFKIMAFFPNGKLEYIVKIICQRVRYNWMKYYNLWKQKQTQKSSLIDLIWTNDI